MLAGAAVIGLTVASSCSHLCEHYPSAALAQHVTAAPPPPAPGTQQRVQLPPGSPPCVALVESKVRSWAAANRLGCQVGYESQQALDVEMVPADPDALPDVSLADVLAFENRCSLSRAHPDRREPLRNYLLAIKLQATAVSEHEIVRLGFGVADAKRLRSQLSRFEGERRALHRPPLYRGIRYFRLTYSLAPRAEITVNTGTVAGYTLTQQQRDLAGTLMSTVKAAASCPSDNPAASTPPLGSKR